MTDAIKEEINMARETRGIESEKEIVIAAIDGIGEIANRKKKCAYVSPNLAIVTM
jgi:hypothetical protein